MFIRILVCTLVLSIAPIALADEVGDQKMDALNEQILPRAKAAVEALNAGTGSTPEILNDLGATAQAFNSRDWSAKPKEVVAIAYNPYHFRTWLNEWATNTAAVAFCAEDNDVLRSCTDAAQYLRAMTAQCSQTVLGTIDIDVYPDVSLNILKKSNGEPPDPNLILLKRPVSGGALYSTGLLANPAPDTVAIVLCLQESNIAGHVFRFQMPFQ